MAVQYSFKISLFMFLLYSPCVFITMANTIDTTMLCHEHERSALLHFKQSLSISSNSSAYLKTASWKATGDNSSDCCSWDGVECDDDTGFVIGLDLSSSLTSGTLHSNSTLFSLVHLQNLNLADNIFMNSSIPPEISHLPNLSCINLSNSSFSGQIPLELSGVSKLTSLDLSNNNLNGGFPIGIFHLPDLLVLNVSGNKNLTGYLPEFNQTSSFRALELDSTNFSGNVPASIGNLQLLTKLRLGRSYFQDQFRPQLNNLETLILTGNYIHGQVPAWLWNASDSLEMINLSGNFLTGMEQNLSVLPGKSLGTIDISNNILQGNLPIPPTNVVAYNVWNNRLTGEIPNEICGLKSLKVLQLFYNNMTGQIPWCLGNSLSVLNLGSNNFSGTIPQIYTEECNLKVMDLSQNKLEGQLPRSLSNCRMLQFLDLGDNKLEDTFPFWLGALPQLQVLVLHANKFFGATASSPSIGSVFPMLRIIDVSQNSFSGDLPVEYIQKWNAMKSLSSDVDLYMLTKTKYQYGKYSRTDTYWSSIILKNKGLSRQYNKIPNIFSAIDFSSNRFTGEIPKSFGSLEALLLLDLSNNELTGPIPPSLGNLRQLESLDLSQNKLSGAIPQQLASQLNFLVFFNVSYNLLSGSIPQGPQFSTFENSSHLGNPGLCAFPLSEKCATVKSPAADNNDDSDEFPNVSDWIFIFAGVGSGLVTGFVLGNIITDRHPWMILEAAKVLRRKRRIT